jgi:alpha-2-macroglobulin
MQPVAVTLAAVDTGVLSLTRFATPDPFDWFFGARAYTGQLRDTYGDLMEISRAAAARQRFGGDADLARGGDAPQSEVQIVALFSGKVMLDESGRAEIPLELPYFNGELRLMAVAFDARRVSHAERTLKGGRAGGGGDQFAPLPGLGRPYRRGVGHPEPAAGQPHAERRAPK